MSPNLKCTLVQSSLHWEDVEANLAAFDAILSGIKEETDLIILPEMFTTGFTMKPKGLATTMDGKLVQWMQRWAESKNAVLMGSAIVEEEGVYYNRLLVVDKGGVFAHYDKRHLFTLAGENKPYQRGVDRVIVDVKGWHIMPMICYDLRFPVWSRLQKDSPYDLLVYVANWPAPRVSHWDALLKARAIENQAYCIGVNRVGTDGNQLAYVGHSACYSFSGEVVADLAETARTVTVTLEAEALAAYREKLPFLADADAFKIAPR